MSPLSVFDIIIIVSASQLFMSEAEVLQTLKRDVREPVSKATQTQKV